MALEDLVDILEAMASLLGAICWPALVVFVLLYFGSPLRRFIDSMGEFSLKAGPGGVEAAAKRQQIKAAALLGAASARRGEDDTSKDSDTAVNEIARAVSQATESRKAGRLVDAQVLWVDDRPANNVFERRSMEALGIDFTVSTSTEDALEKLAVDAYDLVISDMGRPPDDRAGYTLLEAMRRRGIDVPVVFYAGSGSPEHRAEARRRGAVSSTNSPQELFQLVTSTLLGR
jgi:CheY-like chemotaxis protein